jgi:hypothetical protein
LIEEEVAKATIRSWLDKCLRRIKRERQHLSLLHSLRATNEPLIPLNIPTADTEEVGVTTTTTNAKTSRTDSMGSNRKTLLTPNEMRARVLPLVTERDDDNDSEEVMRKNTKQNLTLQPRAHIIVGEVHEWWNSQ